MNRGAPAFQVYPKDLLADSRVAVLPLPAFGLFVRLLLYAWLEAGVPDDPATIAAVLRESPRTIERLWPAVAALFEQRDGRLVYPDQERQRAEHEAHREKSRQGGLRSGQSRRSLKGGSTTVEPANTVAVQPTLNTPISDLRSAGSTERADAAASAGESVQAFLAKFCELYSANRAGARYLVAKTRDVPNVRRLLATYGPERLVALADAMLKLPRGTDAWLDGTDRGINALTTKASWLDARLREKPSNERNSTVPTAAESEAYMASVRRSA